MPAPNHWIVTGNFTDDGAVAWRRADGTWSRTIHDAGLVDEAQAKAHAAHAIAHEQRQICDPYGVEVYADAGVIDPLTARQRIRANGPTTPIRRPDGGVAR
jgi:hypothetical protein